MLLFEGTGKSVTGAHLALAFVMYNDKHPPSVVTLPSADQKTSHAKRPVMYCAPSNKAVDRVLGETMHIGVSAHLIIKAYTI